MEEEDLAAIGEGTPTPSASETQPAEEAEKSEVGTSVQPESEATSETPRGQTRIKELVRERNYWKDLAQANAPKKEEKKEEAAQDGDLTIDQVADAVDERFERREAAKRAEEARQLALEDAEATAAKYPELDTDVELQDAVIALAQHRGIPIMSAADLLIGKIKAKETRAQAEEKAKEGASTPDGAKAGGGATPKIDVWNLPETERKANWNKYIEQFGGQ